MDEPILTEPTRKILKTFTIAVFLLAVPLLSSSAKAPTPSAVGITGVSGLRRVVFDGFAVASLPEPALLTLGGMGLILTGLIGRKRRSPK